MAYRRRVGGAVVAALAVAGLAGVVGQPAGAAPTGTGAASTGATEKHGSTPGWSELRHQFDYQRQPIRVAEHGVTRQGGALVHDISYSAPGQDPVSAYLVTPVRHGTFAGAIFLHWLSEEPNANRTQYLDEAVALAGGGRGLVSLLPQLEFPFAFGPVGDKRDKDSVVKQVVQLRRGLDLLQARHDVDDSRVAVVGHDYGAMFGSLMAAVDRDRVRAEVLTAADATFGNWFSVFFLGLEGDADTAYRALLAPLDPIVYVAHAPAGGILFQYATDDFFIPNDVAAQVVAAASGPKTVRSYDTDHALEVPAARADRDAFLIRTLHL
jgi:pimeloyl-ACP methyl ester carboxylesterase